MRSNPTKDNITAKSLGLYNVLITVTRVAFPTPLLLLPNPFHSGSTDGSDDEGGPLVDCGTFGLYSSGVVDTIQDPFW